jgi:low temperature requirement protein LtrA
VVVAAALWWLYFDRESEEGERAVEAAQPGIEQNRLARDSYSYMHLPMAAGIVLLAYGIKNALAHVDEPLTEVAAFAACAGVAVYLVAQLGFRARTAQAVGPALAVGAVASLALIPVAAAVEATWAVAMLVALTTAVVIWDVRAAGTATGSVARS